MTAVNYMKLDTYEKPYVLIPLSDAALNFYRVRYGVERIVIQGALNGPFAGLLELMTEKLPYTKHRVSKRIPHKKLWLFLPKELKFSKIQEHSVMAAGTLLEDWFRQQFVSFVHGGVAVGSSESGAVKAFMSAYRIEVDMWDNDSARMYYRRSMGYEK
jgi:hypothetical protein